MNPVDDILLRFGGEDANAEPWLGEGWQGPEPDFRWTDGFSSVVRLPPLRARPWFVLTLYAHPIGGVAQPVTVRLNGVELIRYRHANFVPFDIVVPGYLVREDGDNALEIDHPEPRRPVECEPGAQDTRQLALAFQSISLEALDAPFHLAPRLLPDVEAPSDAEQAKAVAEAFQSLGQHCDCGLFQRHYGAEPFGLLRFASIFPHILIEGLRNRFAGIDDPDALSFFCREGGLDYDGLHAVYGLAYHTFKKVAETDVATLAVKEAQRLKYLARLFFEQLESNEKIFVRVEDFHAPGEALALHRLLRTFHPQARLLLLDGAPAHARERVGRVIELRPGLYRGYFSRRSDLAGTHDPILYAEWLRLCATVLAYERGRA